MEDIYYYSYVEDCISAEVVKRLVAQRNATTCHNLIRFYPGFPVVKGGYGAIKRKAGAFLKMAQSGLRILILTDLDKKECAAELMQKWFFPKSSLCKLPKEIIFRVAIREVESWVMADRSAFAEFMGITVRNFSDSPDKLDDPKQYLLKIIQKKGKKKWHKEMLPRNDAHIGPMYNEEICKFIKNKWSPKRAAVMSLSLCRAIDSLCKL